MTNAHTMTITFVTANKREDQFVDLSHLIPANVRVGDEVLMAATGFVMQEDGVPDVSDPFITIDLDDGMDIEAGENINVQILERSTGGIRNPLTAREDNQIRVSLSNDADAYAESAKYSFGPRVTLSPDDPGASTRITFEFFLQNKLVANEGQLRFQFDKDWKNIPTTMSRSSITIRADRVLDANDDSAPLLVQVSVATTR